MNYEECKCEACVQACRKNPGWFSPEEAERAMDAGLARRMMFDWMGVHSDVHGETKEVTLILAPASLLYEGCLAPEVEFSSILAGSWKKGQCTFLTDEGLCEIHSSGFKPLQCRSLTHREEDWKSNHHLAALWSTPEGRAAVDRWRRKTGCLDLPWEHPDWEA